MDWSFRNRSVTIGARPLVMGIVNVTRDSFSDGGRFVATDAAVEHALRLAAEGADFLDIGGESSRPGSKPVSLDDELARLIPVVRGVAGRSDVPISVDTTKAEVARQALSAGAAVVNDITAATGDANMVDVVREFDAGAILMHMQGTPETMQASPTYGDVVVEVRDYLARRLEVLIAAGIPAERIAIDPGIGFGKTSAHNLTLLRHLDRLSALGRPVVLGVSRKGFVGEIARRPVGDRLAASLAAACYCAAHGSAHILRVHDVAATVDAAKVVGAIAGIGK
ncbi:MAG TPA: dihydropteroate synthase [Gemmataceae bacterium]|nr:dihydropteroate synthase [Gemmataceae bacterium]